MQRILAPWLFVLEILSIFQESSKSLTKIWLHKGVFIADIYHWNLFKRCESRFFEAGVILIS